MRLSVATNFQSTLIDALQDYPVVELYGKLRQDAVGGGRAPYQLAPVGRRQLAHHVSAARRAGMGFNYLLNSACLGNHEITRQGQREIEKLLDWICRIGIGSVTVATPYLLTLIKTRFPQLKVRVSLFAGVERVQKAKMWQDLGADCIVLDSIQVNRELKTLEQIRRHVRCDLELLVNNNCLMNCALSPSHMNAIAHTAQSFHQTNGFFIDWCFLKCTEMKLRAPINYIRSEWIRPEDLHVYEELGYDLFKIVERDIPTEVLTRRVKAYVERRYDGNLLDLIQPFGFQGVKKNDRYYRRGLKWLLQHLFRPTLVNPLKLMLLKRLADSRGMTSPIEGEAPVYIDNRALDGFIERFRENSCRDADCGECGWCAKFAAKAVRFDAPRRDETLAAYDALFGALNHGDMWRYLPRDHGACHECACSSHASQPVQLAARKAGTLDGG